jgi:monoamine oxidase
MANYDVDVCVIGGGAAGLTAAWRVALENRTAMVIEARERLGGRIDTVFPEGHRDLAVELGAEFIHGRHPSLFDLCRSNNLSLTEINGAIYHDSGDGLQPADEDDDAIDDLLSSPEMARQDEPFSRFLDRSSLDAEHRMWAKSFVEGFNAADSTRIGTRALYHQSLAEQEIEGDRSWRLPDGYVGVTKALEKRVPIGMPILLGTVTTKVAWQPGSVRVYALGPDEEPVEVHARAVIITVPLGVLLGRDSRSRVTFEPKPAIFRDLNLILSGTAVRLNLVFSEPVWERSAPDCSFLLSHEPNFPTWWPRKAASGYLLTGWNGGPKAAKLPTGSKDEMVRLALIALANLLSATPEELKRQLESAHFHDWHADPFSCGAYSYVTAGGFEFSQRIASGIDKTLWLAGEAIASDGNWGTVHGAIASGERAAEELLRTL